MKLKMMPGVFEREILSLKLEFNFYLKIFDYKNEFLSSHKTLKVKDSIGYDILMPSTSYFKYFSVHL